MKSQGASATAKVIAASTILLGSKPSTSALVAPNAASLCKMFLSGSRADRCLARSAANPVTRRLWLWLERKTLPGIVAHYWHRKRWIERRCRDAIHNGISRLIVLGAGFDTLGARLAVEFPQLDVIEIDHAGTQRAKQKTLTANPGVLPNNLRFIALDLSAEPMPASLLKGSCATTVVIEGLLMYLAEAHVAHLFDSLSTLPRSSRILFSFMTRWPDGRLGFRPRSWLVERWLAWRGEPFTWALEPDAMQRFLAAHHVRLLEMVLTNQLTEQSAAGISCLEGENIVECEPA